VFYGDVGPFVFNPTVNRIEWVIENCRLLASIGEEKYGQLNAASADEAE